MLIRVAEPGEIPIITENDGNPKEMQQIKGVILQAICPFSSKRVARIYNDEDKALCLPLNYGVMITETCTTSSAKPFSCAARRPIVIALQV